MARIQFCENNYSQDAEEVIEMLKNDGVELEIENCLGYCGDCATGIFAVVDDELVQAEDPDELYYKIKDLIEEYR